MPFCFFVSLLQLETAATCGVAMVVLMIALLAFKAWQAGFPAIASGEFPLWSLKIDEHLPEAFAVVGYAFYMQVNGDVGHSIQIRGREGSEWYH